jgi:hypothetical protein
MFLRPLCSRIALQLVAFVAIAAGISNTHVCLAQEWAGKMFETKKQDFGTVSRNAKAEQSFPFKNIYKERLHISAVRSSCGCTKPMAESAWVESGETSQILAQFNTRSFIGTKSAVITVVFDQPYYAEVQLTVSGTIRSDIVTEPGAAQFGDVPVGETREIPIRLSYAGRSDWQVTDVRGASDSLEVSMVRSQGRRGEVQYVLNVRLKQDAPIGDLQDELVVVTNDLKNSTFSLPVSARIVPPVSITPRYVTLGGVRAGSAMQQRLVVRGKEPFEISEIVCDDDRFEFKIPSGARPIHIVPFLFNGTGNAGRFDQKVIVKTSLGKEIEADCIVTGEVIQ